MGLEDCGIVIGAVFEMSHMHDGKIKCYMRILAAPMIGMVLASVDPYDLSGVMPRECHAW